MKSYSISEVADALAVHERTVEEWILAGELKAVITSRRRNSQRPRRRIMDSDLQRFLESRYVAPPAPPPPGSPKRALEGVHEFF
ncbi:MAG: helix-turn-helix domain-containing protein [Planctomycetaceae bacterium]|nr:helix-turn-helix domain-containing protein [Planctomycetaceae bacterium]